MHVMYAAIVGFIVGAIVSYLGHVAEARVVSNVEGAFEARWSMLEKDVRDILAKVSQKV